jgi:hypothetical protein
MAPQSTPIAEAIESGTVIFLMGHPARFHSTYYGWELYRCIDGGQPRMHYIAVKCVDGGCLVSIESRNLDGIKERVRKQEGAI